jgi:hypothetical protein
MNAVCEFSQEHLRVSYDFRELLLVDAGKSRVVL